MMSLCRTILLGVLWLGAAVIATSAAAATPAPSAEAAAWIAQHTDMRLSQAVIVDSDVVYGLEPLAPFAPTHEVVGLVRTEVVNPAWSGTPGVRSWDALILFDCGQGRLRVIRSASYPEVNRMGHPKVDDVGGDWRAPEADQPVSKLFAAACDPSFAWPLRGQTAAGLRQIEIPKRVAKFEVVVPPKAAAAKPIVKAAAAAPPQVEAPKLVAEAAVVAPPEAAAPQPVETPKLAAEAAAAVPPEAAAPQRVEIPGQVAKADLPPKTAAAAPGAFAVQVAYGRSREAAARDLEKAQQLFEGSDLNLVAVTARSLVGSKRRYTAILTGFPDAQAASEACKRIVRAGQRCLVRSAPEPDPASRGSTKAAAMTPAVAAISEARNEYAIQIAHGPFKAGASKALRNARRTLGSSAEGLRAEMAVSRLGRRTRYTAMLAGFASPNVAAEACRTLKASGRLCLVRVALRSARTDPASA
jgi:hypothetical protein